MRKQLDRAGEIDRLELIATRIRKNAIDHITKSKVGHPGGSLSVADILTVLYFGRLYRPESKTWERVMRYDPADPLWLGRDRLIMSKGHAAPGLYAALAEAGFFPESDLKIYNKMDSPLEGHPAMYRILEEGGRKVEHGIKGIDFSSGSLGHGLSVAAGMALQAKVYQYDYLVYAILGDGDLQEGMTWEAMMTIPNKGLGRVCGFIDYNRLQVDGCTDDLNSLDPLAEKLAAFNWEVRVVSGHDFYALMDAVDHFKRTAAQRTRPLMVVANTIKGRGITECENVCRFHAMPLDLEEWGRAEAGFQAKISALEKKLEGKAEVEPAPLDKTTPKEPAQDLERIIKLNPARPYTEPTATRIGYGRALARLGEYEPIFVLNADLAGACASSFFSERYPEDAPRPRDRRSINLGVQEANMMTMGAALASCGRIPVVNSFGIFSTGRAWEMVRQDIAYPRLNVKIIGSHTGVALGEYGVSHQAIEDVGLMRTLPHLTIIEPSDAIQADRLFQEVLAHQGPVYFRVGRNPTPLFYAPGNRWGVEPRTDFKIGRGYLLREGTDLTLIASGPILAEALEVAARVQEKVRVIDMPTIRPIDRELVTKAAEETGWVCTVQDHFENGGLSDEVMKVLVSGTTGVRFDSVALSGYAESGSAAELYEKYGLSANRIIAKLGLREK